MPRYYLLVAILLGSLRLDGALPLVFEPNHGQYDPSIRYVSRRPDFSVLLKQDRAILASGKETVEVLFAGGHAEPRGTEPTGGRSNYLKGPDPESWRTGIPHYARVRYVGVYPGVDLVFYGNGQRLEFDFLVHPGADPAAIRLKVAGARKVALGKDGSLSLHSGDSEFRFPSPEVYQPTAAGRRPVRGAYRLGRAGTVSFNLGAYDRSNALVIDPVLYTTYWGGIASDIIFGTASDSGGNIYLTGYSNSFTFTTTAGAYKTALASGDADAFVTKLNPAGTAVVYSTFLGGPSSDLGRAIAVDASGAAYVTGSTIGRFPVTAGAFRQAPTDAPEIFAAKIGPTGATLEYATYLGGAGSGQGIAVDSSGSAIVAGFTYTPSFPLVSPLQSIYWGGQEGFVAKLDATGTALLYSTFLGGQGEDQATAVAVDSSGSAYVAGYTSGQGYQTTSGVYQASLAGGTDAFILKISSSGAAVYSTYLGGGSNDRANAIAVDGAGNAYVGGQTASANFPVTAGAFQTIFGGGGADGFVAKLGPAGAALAYSSYLGGNGACQVSDSIRSHICDSVFAIAVDSTGTAYLGGLAGSGFPLVAAQQTVAGGAGDGFAARMDSGGAQLLYSTFIGGTSQDVVLGVIIAAGTPVMAGLTSSTNIPVSAGALRAASSGGLYEGFVTALNSCPVTLGSSGSFFPPGSGTFQLDVFAANSCAWNASSNVSWITFNTVAGIGNGQVSYNVATNTGPHRVGQISVGGQSFTVEQITGACFQLGYYSSWFPQAGGSFSLPVFGTCAWAATSNVPWVTITSGSGSGNGQVDYTLSANNTGEARFGQIDVSGQKVDINQVGGAAGLACQYSPSRTQSTFDRSGGSSSILISTAPGCEWNVSTTQSWIRITGGLAGSGTGIVGYTVAANTTGQPRTGQVLVSGIAISITQLN